MTRRKGATSTSGGESRCVSHSVFEVSQGILGGQVKLIAERRKSPFDTAGKGQRIIPVPQRNMSENNLEKKRQNKKESNT